MKQSPERTPHHRPVGFRCMSTCITLLFFVVPLVLVGCGNNPYPAAQDGQPIIYSRLGDDPKTLDPSISYRIDEGTILASIYNSYFQYHYLKQQPVRLELALGAKMPTRK